MTQNITIGPQENRLLLSLAEKEISVFSFDEAKSILQTSNSSVRHILMNLTKKNRLRRIERGMYLRIPEIAGQELHWSESPWVILQHLVDVYYVGFLTAMNYWGMTEQIPYTIFVVTTKRKRNLKFGNQRFEFVTLSKKKFFGFIEEKASKTEFFKISSKEKTIVDGLMHPEYCGGIPGVIKAMWNIRKEVDWKIILKMAEQVKINVVLKRLAYLLDILEIENDISKLIMKKLRQYPYHYLDPQSKKKKVVYSKKYGLIINRTKDELLGWMDY